jgi:hypothetical protein
MFACRDGAVLCLLLVSVEMGKLGRAVRRDGAAARRASGRAVHWGFGGAGGALGWSRAPGLGIDRRHAASLGAAWTRRASEEQEACRDGAVRRGSESTGGAWRRWEPPGRAAGMGAPCARARDRQEEQRHAASLGAASPHDLDSGDRSLEEDKSRGKIVFLDLVNEKNKRCFTVGDGSGHLGMKICKDGQKGT